MGLPKGRTNNPNGRTPRTPEQMREFLLSKRKISGECWIWTGAVNQWGYGQTAWQHRHTMVHRVAACLWKKFDITSQLKVCHSCDQPRCFNPDHLWFGTDADNSRDCTAKGRQFQQRKTHCIHGHEFTKQNTCIKSTTGERVCRACRRNRQKARLARRRM